MRKERRRRPGWRRVRAFVCSAWAVGLLACRPEPETFETGPWLAVDAANRRAFAMVGRKTYVRDEALSSLWAVSVDDGTVQTLLPEVSGGVRTGLTPDYLVASTDERSVVFERGSLAELLSFPGDVVAETSVQANLALTRQNEMLQLDSQRRLAALEPPSRATLAFTRAGGQLLVVSCPGDRYSSVRVRTFTVAALAAADDWAALTPDRDFTLNAAGAAHVSYGGDAMPACIGPIYESPSGRYLAATLRRRQPLVIDLQTESGRVATPEGDADWIRWPRAFGFSPDEHSLLVIGGQGGVLQVDLPALTIADTQPEPTGFTWKDFVLVGTACGELLVYDKTVPERAPAIDPRSRCQPKDGVLWGFLYKRGVELTSGDPAPVPAIDASLAYYVPDLDRIVGLRSDPPALLVAAPNAAEPAVQVFELPAR